VESSKMDDFVRPERFEGIILVYSLSNANSLPLVLRWWELSGMKSLATVIVGNKTDEIHDKKLFPSSKALAMADRHSIKLFEVSAKTNNNIRIAVQSLIESIMLKKIVKPLTVPPSLIVAAPGDQDSIVILVLGIPGSGRSSVSGRIAERIFPMPTARPIGDEVTAVLQINGVLVRLMTPASEIEALDRIPDVDRAAGYLLVYDLTSDDSFTRLVQWFEKCPRATLPTVMVGNRIDEAHLRKVTLDRAVQWGSSHQIKVFEVSAKLGLFCQLAAEYLVELIRAAPK